MICIVHKWLKITNKRCISTFSFDYRKPSAPGWRRNRCLGQRRDECRREGFPLHSEEQTMKYSRQTGGGRVIINKRQQRRNNKAWYEVFVKRVLLGGSCRLQSEQGLTEASVKLVHRWSLRTPGFCLIQVRAWACAHLRRWGRFSLKGLWRGQGCGKVSSCKNNESKTEAPGLASERSPLCFYLCYW